eukprot:6882657-Prorocentrum_lima.AAC.1
MGGGSSPLPAGWPEGCALHLWPGQGCRQPDTSETGATRLIPPFALPQQVSLASLSSPVCGIVR